MKGFIRLAGREWPVRKATVGATILPSDEADFQWGPGTGGISWSFRVETMERTFNESPLAPSVAVDCFTVPLRTWHELADRAFDWSCQPDEDDDTDRDRPIICLHDHEDILDCKARFGGRRGKVVAFELVGKCPFFSSADRLHVQTRLTFEGVGVRAREPKAAWARLCEHLDGKDFSPAPIRSGEGYIVFEPALRGTASKRGRTKRCT